MTCYINYELLQKLVLIMCDNTQHWWELTISNKLQISLNSKQFHYTHTVQPALKDMHLLFLPTVATEKTLKNNCFEASMSDNQSIIISVTPEIHCSSWLHTKYAFNCLLFLLNSRNSLQYILTLILVMLTIHQVALRCGVKHCHEMTF